MNYERAKDWLRQIKPPKIDVRAWYQRNNFEIKRFAFVSVVFLVSLTLSGYLWVKLLTKNYDEPLRGFIMQDLRGRL